MYNRYDCNCSSFSLETILRSKPCAEAMVRGSDECKNINGCVKFFKSSLGTVVLAEISGLPNKCGECGDRIFGFHIHEGSACCGTQEDSFAETLAHYNPNDCAHPFHKGDLPALFGNNGYAVSAFLTNRFKVEEVIGRTVVIHDMPDDFNSQPAGNSGKKIACGKIVCTK